MSEIITLDGERLQVATIRVILRKHEIDKLVLATRNDGFHIDVRMGKRNAELMKVEDTFK